MLELFTKKPVFQGHDEIHQLEVLYKILGTPSIGEWAEFTEMPWFELVKPNQVLKNRFRALFNEFELTHSQGYRTDNLLDGFHLLHLILLNRYSYTTPRNVSLPRML